MYQYIVYRDFHSSGKGFDPFTVKFSADRQTAIDLAKSCALLFPSDTFALCQWGKDGWVWKDTMAHFTRKKHSHKCLGCVPRGQLNAVVCYNAHCTKPKVTDTCEWCNPKCLS